ncbi:MAG: M23 family metallopeptidase [Campylobacterota bacterium]|nr:M23 family metallopeptidase [Campylobacterota bacterium]
MRKKNSSSIVGWIILAMMLSGVVYVYNSVMFERVSPTISLKNNGYWNLRKPLELSMSDVSGIKSYRVILKTDTAQTILYDEQLIVKDNLVNIKIKPPRSAYAISDKILTIVVEVVDGSKWDFLEGNIKKEEFKLIIDKKRPMLDIVGHSYKISKGGSALVIFKVNDENLKDIRIKTNYGKEFKAQPFYKDGYYISLLAWPITEKSFKADIIATDLAKNSSKSYIPLYLKQKYYRVSNIKISDRFLKGKIADLAYEFVETQGITDRLKQFKIINEDVRAKNEKLIHEITSKVSDEMISDFKINKMYPLRNGAVVAYFGDHRKYTYAGEPLSEAYHLGLDLASNSLAEIRPQNGGEVVYVDYNGLYGNMPVVSHGLGLYTLYGHCSSVNVNKGDVLEPNGFIANSGKSGYAMGDHLHFGVLVQGIEVRPQEWMDKDWIKLNITKVIKEAKKIIDGN